MEHQARRSRLILATQNKKLARSRFAPIDFPFVVVGIIVGFQVELGMKQLLAAKTDTHNPSLLVGL